MKKTKNKKNTIRKPKTFGVQDDIHLLGFKINHEDGVVVQFGWNDKEGVYLDSKCARYLAKKLTQAAEYLEYRGF